MERATDFKGGEMEEKDLRVTNHRGHDHLLVLRESLQEAVNWYGGGRVIVHCDGCGEPISSSSSSGAGGGGGAFYACHYSGCWFLLHKRCAELPPEIEHPSHPEHALTLQPFLFLDHTCDVCDSEVDGFIYRCSNCDFDIHIRCASMALHIQDRVDENNKIHKHSLIPIEIEAQFVCAPCGREHKGKSYLCPTCGFWANQICASAPPTVDLHNHPHPLALFCPANSPDSENCKICKKEVKRACWAYFCSEGCGDSVHVDCSLLEQAENSNKDIQANLHSETTSHKSDEIRRWLPVLNESVQLITQLINNLSSREKHKRDIISIPSNKHTKIFCCKNDHHLLNFLNEKTDKSKDDQFCERCAQTISGEFYHCTQYNFSFHKGCAELPNKLRHILHPRHALHLLERRPDFDIYCHSCDMPTNRLVFGCLSCNFFLDLKCASLPRSIKHEAHDHVLALRMMTNARSCNACGVSYPTHFAFFRCKGCNFGLCIKCTLLPLSVSHRYDKHPFALTYFRIEGQPDEYYCEICEEDIDTRFWFYHCKKCDQSLHPECIYPSIERSMNVKFGELFEANFHSHLLRYAKSTKASCDKCGWHFRKVDCVAYECEECAFWINASCLKDRVSFFQHL